MMHTLAQLLSKIEYTPVGEHDISDVCVSSVTRDSRNASAGSLFVCIKGASFDGHDYAMSAYSNGCRYFLTEHAITLPSDAIQITTKDTRIALAYISAEFFSHPSKELHIVGITGTKGKTTTALTAYHLLNSLGMKAGYIGSNGIQFDSYCYSTANTTPESYELHKYMRLMVDAGVKYLIMEVSSQAVYMNRIHGIEFTTAVFTNLSRDHIGGNEHPTFEHYRDSKKRLFTDFGAKNIIYNADDPHAEYMISEAKCNKTSCSYGNTKNASLRVMNAKQKSHTGSIGVSFDITNGEQIFASSVSAPGIFSVYNALLASAICVSLGASLRKIANTLPDISIKGRFECVDVLQGVPFIIDYAHNGASLTAALNALREYSPRRLICLFGSVGGRTKERRAELGDAASALADLSILTADNPDFETPESVISDIEKSYLKRGLTLNKDYVKIPDRREAIRYAVKEARRGDIVLLAGKGHEDYQLINGKKLPFSELAILKEAASELEVGELV